MKRLNISYSSLFIYAIAIVVVMGSCSRNEDMISDNSNELNGRVVYATASYSNDNNPKTRVSYEDNFSTNNLSLAWSEGDTFTAFIGYNSSQTYDFTIQTPEGGNFTADETFVCTSFPAEKLTSTEIKAFYPNMGSVEDEYVTIDLSQQIQDGNKSIVHLKNYDYMVGNATYDSENDRLNFNFNPEVDELDDIVSGRLASIFRIKMKNLPTDVKAVKKIEILEA